MQPASTFNNPYENNNPYQNEPNFQNKQPLYDTKINPPPYMIPSGGANNPDDLSAIQIRKIKDEAEQRKLKE